MARDGHPLAKVDGSLAHDLELMGQAGVTVSHCSTNLIRRGRSLYSWDRYKKAGVNLTLGSDTYTMIHKALTERLASLEA